MLQNNHQEDAQVLTSGIESEDVLKAQQTKHRRLEARDELVRHYNSGLATVVIVFVLSLFPLLLANEALGEIGPKLLGVLPFGKVIKAVCGTLVALISVYATALTINYSKLRALSLKVFDSLPTKANGRFPEDIVEQRSEELTLHQRDKAILIDVADHL